MYYIWIMYVCMYPNLDNAQNRSWYVDRPPLPL